MVENFDKSDLGKFYQVKIDKNANIMFTLHYVDIMLTAYACHFISYTQVSVTM